MFLQVCFGRFKCVVEGSSVLWKASRVVWEMGEVLITPVDHPLDGSTESFHGRAATKWLPKWLGCEPRLIIVSLDS